MNVVGFPGSAPLDRSNTVRQFSELGWEHSHGEEARRHALALEWAVFVLSKGDVRKYRRLSLNIGYRLRSVLRYDGEMTPGEIVARPTSAFRSMTGIGIQERDHVVKLAQFQRYAADMKDTQIQRTEELKSETVCPACGSRHVDQVDEKQLRAMDEGATFFFECRACGEKFQVCA